jgi:phosphoenolpyruvate synthase/pyruvate phosphate dikinase
MLDIFMFKLNPRDYEYLWTDYDVNFLFTSCYLFKEFRNSDIVLIYDFKNKGLKFFLSKKEKEKLSKRGVILFKKYFSEWERGIIKNIKEGKRLIKITKKDKPRISSINSFGLRRKILERANFFQALAGSYFFTEFFFLDKVERLIKESPGKHKTIVKNFKEMGKLKFVAREILNQFYNYKKIFAPYVEEVGRRFNRKDLPWLSYKEIVDIISGKKVKVSKRNSLNWLLTKKNNWRIITGSEAKKILAKFDDYFFNKKVKTIKGTIASKGFYRGKVKIIKTFFSNAVSAEIKKVKRGDVLVAETTGPEMMIACKRAGAIVTDEGGLTSHAAIVSRELGIPCVIGTKIATKVLHDGDLVEVDANHGVVKVIKCV